VTGSFFIAAELRELLLAQAPDAADSTERASTAVGPAS
jgi:hypothetical protein